MIQTHHTILSLAVLSLTFSACIDRDPPKPPPVEVGDGSGAKAKAPQGDAKTPNAPKAKNDPNAAGAWSGKVAETMDAGGYSYVLLDTGTEKKWVAGPAVAGLEVGKKISVVQPMPMPGFESPTLKRKFEVLYFVGAIQVEGASTGSTVSPHAGNAGQTTPPKTSLPKTSPHGTASAKPKSTEPVAKLEGGYTVAELYAKRKELNGKTVKIRARVAKFLPEIMDTNWLHIEDGTGEGATARLRVTTSESPKVGEVVILEGTLSADKDLGSGYSYPALLEKAKITRK